MEPIVSPTPPGSGSPAEAGAAARVAQLFQRQECRSFDLLDVAVVDAMLALLGRAALRLGRRGGCIQLHADADQLAAVRLVFWSADPARMERWLPELAAVLLPAVVRRVGSSWSAEAEVWVDIALAMRADDVEDLVEQLAAGPVVVDAGRTPSQVLAAGVCDPALVEVV